MSDIKELKDEELEMARMKAECDTTRADLNRGFPVSAEESKKITSWISEHEKILSDSTYGSVTTEWLGDFLNSTKARRKANEDRKNESISQLKRQYQELEDEMAAIDYEIDNAE